MKAKPKHLGPQYAAQFHDASLATAYGNRAPYPEQTVEILAPLLAGSSSRILDAGCGTGDLSRLLAEIAHRVDALDPSNEMIKIGRRTLGLKNKRIRWIVGSAEDALLEPPYSLITAGEAVHWMDWQVVFRRFARLLDPDGVFAIVERVESRKPWDPDLQNLIRRYSTNREYRAYDLRAELTSRELLRGVCEQTTDCVEFRQSIDEHIEAMHSRNGFSRERMGARDAQRFDSTYRNLLETHCRDGVVTLRVRTRIIWGTPSPVDLSNVRDVPA